jgi:4-amino-4-deoxy-L-arabinose transferase-like glycosyltransferase
VYNKSTLKKFLILVVLVIALVLRVYQLDKVPPSLFGDEIDVGYQAYSLLKTGKDIKGNSWPILIESLSEHRAPLFIYSDIPFIAIFGLNEWGVRLASVFWGVLGILGLYLLTRKLFNEKLGLLAAGFLTISPWHIHYSRAGFEVTMLLMFLVFGAYFFLKGLEKKQFLIISAVLFGLTPYIYQTAVVFMPSLIGLLVILNRQILRKNLKINFLVVLTLVFIMTPFIVQTFAGEAGNRFGLISIFGNKGTEEKVTILQQRENLPLGLERVFHNKPIVMMQNFSINYLRTFSPEFLFLQGDPNARHSIHEMGEMYFFEVILLLTGLFLILKSKTPEKKLILGWLLLSPIPASLTYDGGFHATRNFILLPPLMILLSLGLKEILDKKYKFLGMLILTLFIFNFIFFLHRYFVDYPLESSRAWQFGFKESMQYVATNSKDYQRILINNTYEPSLIRFLFWTKYDPDKFHNEFRGDNPKGFSLENKFYFGSVNGPFEEILNSQILYIASARDEITNPETLNDKRVKLLETIYSPSKEVIFYIVTGRK